LKTLNSILAAVAIAPSILISGIGSALAQALSSPRVSPSVAPVTLNPVVVSGTRLEQSSFSLPMSIDVVEGLVVQDSQPRINLSESLSRVPGVFIQNRQNYAQDLQVSIRGFGARSTFGIRGIRLVVDDIPASMPDGQG
jgi:iron complex outermembrane receptor protein